MDDSADKAFKSLSGMIAECSPERQPTRETVDLFLGLLDRSEKSVPDDIREAIKRIERHLRVIAQKHAMAGQFSP